MDSARLTSRSSTEYNSSNTPNLEFLNNVLKEGWLTKEGRRVKNWRKRYFVLRNGTVYYYANAQKQPNSLKGKFELVGCVVKMMGIRDADDNDNEAGHIFISSASASSNATSPPQGLLGTSSLTIPQGATPTTPSSNSGVSASAHFSLNLTPPTQTFNTPTPDQDQDQKFKQDEGPPIQEFNFKFSIEGAGRVLLMAAASEEDRLEWVQLCHNAINVHTYLEDCKRFNNAPPITGVIEVLMDHNQRDLGLENQRLTLDSTRALGEVLHKNFTITRLVLNNCSLTDAFSNILAVGLSCNDVIEYLDLSHNRIGDSGIADILDGLYISISLKTLIISHNVFGDDGATHVSDLLKANVSLRKIDISHNLISVEGAKALSRSLASNTLLEVLELGSNSIGDEGATFLADGLRQNKTLQYLGLSNNSIGSKGMNAFCEGLSTNRSITDLDITGNLFEKKGASALVNALRDHKTIARIDLGENNALGVDGIKAISEVLKSRFSLSKLVMKRPAVGVPKGNAINGIVREEM